MPATNPLMIYKNALGDWVAQPANTGPDAVVAFSGADESEQLANVQAFANFMSEGQPEFLLNMDSMFALPEGADIGQTFDSLFAATDALDWAGAAVIDASQALAGATTLLEAFVEVGALFLGLVG